MANAWTTTRGAFCAKRAALFESFEHTVDTFANAIRLLSACAAAFLAALSLPINDRSGFRGENKDFYRLSSCSWQQWESELTATLSLAVYLCVCWFLRLTLQCKYAIERSAADTVQCTALFVQHTTWPLV